MRVADRRSDRHGWMEVAANGGRQLSRVLARVVIDGGRGERGIVCCGIVGPSWKCSTCSRETVSRASLSLALSYTTVYKLSAERVLPLGCCFSLRRGEVLLYRAYPRRDIERIYVYICILAFPLSFMIHLPPPLYNNARPPPSFVIYTSLNFEPSSPPRFSPNLFFPRQRENRNFFRTERFFFQEGLSLILRIIEKKIPSKRTRVFSSSSLITFYSIEYSICEKKSRDFQRRNDRNKKRITRDNRNRRENCSRITSFTIAQLIVRPNRPPLIKFPHPVIFVSSRRT